MLSDVRPVLIPDATETRVIVLPPTSADGAAIGKLFNAHQIAFVLASTATHLCEALRAGAGALIVSEEALLLDVEELTACIAAQPVWSDLPIIVLSRSGHGSSALDAVIVQLGNVSVVERPIRTSTLVSLVRSHLRARNRQYQVREYLAQQKHAQEVIAGGERRYRSLIENVTDYAIFMTDLTGAISSWNSGAEEILGFSSQEALGQSIDLFSTEEDFEGGVLKQEIERARQTSRATSARWKVRKDGERLYIESVLVAVRNDAGECVGFANFLKDVTERHRSETEREQLLQSERAARSEAERASRTKDEFLATLSHELRTPLNAVLGWAQILRQTPGLPSEVSHAVTVIERNARAQAQIIEDLLDMSSIISGKVRLDVQRLDVASVVNATVETVKPAAQAKDIRLHVVLDPLAGPVRGDPNRLQQVFWNLLTNAVKFTSKGGRVTVTLARVNSHLEVEIADNGEGIDPAFLPHVFDRFRQADPTSTRRHGGLGLGLSIVKQLIELHGGAITARSAGRGRGAAFRITLPLMATAEDPAEVAAARDHPTRSTSLPIIDELPPTDLTGVKILVVDDEADARGLIRRLLEDCHASVLTAASADEAVGVLMAHTPDILVSDIGMPDEDGYGLMRRIRALSHPQASIPAVALTAYARVEDRVKAIHAGFQLHLSKPVEPVELIAMVASLARVPPTRT